MVQIMPILQSHNEELKALAVPGFILMADGYNAVLFGLAIFACFGSWLLGVLDTKYGVRTAVFITSIIMLLAGVLGLINNTWCVVAATWMLGLFMGASRRRNSFLHGRTAQSRQNPRICRSTPCRKGKGIPFLSTLPA